MSMVEWLREQVDTDERLSLAATEGPWKSQGWGQVMPAPPWYVTPWEHNSVADAEHGDTESRQANARHIAEHDPARVLRQVQAMRRILSRHSVGTTTSPNGKVRYYCEWCQVDDGVVYWEWPCHDIRDLASIYSHRPGYLPEWAPEEVTA